MIVQSLFFCNDIPTWLIDSQDNNYRISLSLYNRINLHHKRIIHTQCEYIIVNLPKSVIIANYTYFRALPKMANTSPTLRDYAKIIYPDSTAEQYSPLWSYRAKFVLRATYYHNAFQLIASSITPSLLETLCKQCPRFLEKSFRPYIVNDSSAIERAQFVVQHYQFVSEKLPAHIRDEIYVNENGLTLFDFTVGEIDYSFKLVFHARYQKEGDMSLLLFNDIDKNFYTLTFSVRDIEGQRQLVIGGLLRHIK